MNDPEKIGLYSCLIAGGGFVLALAVASLSAPLGLFVFLMSQATAVAMGVISRRTMPGAVGLSAGSALVLVGLLTVAAAAGSSQPETTEVLPERTVTTREVDMPAPPELPDDDQADPNFGELRQWSENLGKPDVETLPAETLPEADFSEHQEWTAAPHDTSDDTDTGGGDVGNVGELFKDVPTQD